MDEIECTKCIYNINNECKIGGWTIPKVGCEDGKEKPMTNADKIRAMTDEELANMWWSYVDCGECPMHRECNMLTQDCLRLALKWLKQENETN